jgi:enoyl-[acyl-carrier-protein] reductase (NADH)
MRRRGSDGLIVQADVVSLLCSERASWITGQVIYADGGASLMNPEVPPELQIG